jgi:hypothetical protein
LQKALIYTQFPSIPDPKIPQVIGPPGSGSGSANICTDLDPSNDKKKTKEKTLDLYNFVTSNNLLSLQTDVNVSTESNKQTFRKNNKIFVIFLLES